MSFQDLVITAQKHFPSLQIQYKDQSWFMKLMGIILFFNKSFMTDYVTTIGDTIYIPSEIYMKTHPVSGAVVFMHECVHINDSTNLGKPLFSFLYLLPQIMALFMLPLFFVLSWKIVLPLIILFAAPIPAYFRMKFEKRAYLSSIYTLNKLGQRLNFDPHLDDQKSFFLSQFKDSYYYFMWPFDLSSEFDTALANVQSGKLPFEDPVFTILDDLVAQV